MILYIKNTTDGFLSVVFFNVIFIGARRSTFLFAGIHILSVVLRSMSYKIERKAKYFKKIKKLKKGVDKDRKRVIF